MLGILSSQLYEAKISLPQSYPHTLEITSFETTDTQKKMLCTKCCTFFLAVMSDNGLSTQHMNHTVVREDPHSGRLANKLAFT